MIVGKMVVNGFWSSNNHHWFNTDQTRVDPMIQHQLNLTSTLIRVELLIYY